MRAASVSRLESLLRERKLDRTTFPSFDRKPDDLVATGLPPLDALLGGGFLRGHLSEIVGPVSSGRTSLLGAVFAATMARGEVVALVDACDGFDPVSAGEAGLDLSSLLWVRGRDLTRDPARSLKRALKAMGLVLNAGGFGVAALDLLDVPARVLRQVPMSTWLRLFRLLEHGRTVGLLLAPEPIAMSAEGQTVILDAAPGEAGAGRAVLSVPHARWAGTHDRSRILHGVRSQARVVRTRRPSDAFVTLKTEFPTRTT